MTQITKANVITMNPQDACVSAVDRVLRAVPDILDAIINKAREGSYQHAKFLFDWAKLEPEYDSGDKEAKGTSLAELLLQKLREDKGESDREGATKLT